MAVRARRLFGPVAITTDAAWVGLYTVPSGRTLVVRGLFATVFGGTCQFLWGITAAGSGGPGKAWASSCSAYNATASGGGWVVNPGEVISFYTPANAGVEVWGAGSLLLGAPA